MKSIRRRLLSPLRPAERLVLSQIAVAVVCRASVDPRRPLAAFPYAYQTLTSYLLTILTALCICAAAYAWRVNEFRKREKSLLGAISEKTVALRESERLLRRSKDELEIRVQERTIELVRANQALQTEVFVRRQTQNQMRVAKEEAEASAQAFRIIISTLGQELLLAVNEIATLTKQRLAMGHEGCERDYLVSVARSANSLAHFVAGLAEAAGAEDLNRSLPGPSAGNPGISQLLDPPDVKAAGKDSGNGKLSDILRI